MGLKKKIGIGEPHSTQDKSSTQRPLGQLAPGLLRRAFVLGRVWLHEFDPHPTQGEGIVA